MSVTSRCLRTVLIAAALVTGFHAPFAQGAATISNATFTANFTDFIFRTTDGTQIDASTISVTTGANFLRLDRVELGTGTADATGNAQACNLAECGIISIFPLSIALDAASGASGRGEVRGRSTGELVFENNTGMDLVFQFFLESDVAWDTLSTDDAGSAAFLTWEVRFDYTNGGGQTALSVTQDAPIGGIAVDEVCPMFPSDCSFRQGYTDFSLPNGTTQTFTGVAELFGSAVADFEVPAPSPLALLVPSLLWLARRKGKVVSDPTLGCG